LRRGLAGDGRGQHEGSASAGLAATDSQRSGFLAVGDLASWQSRRAVAAARPEGARSLPEKKKKKKKKRKNIIL
jgi:hypothetical protein